MLPVPAATTTDAAASAQSAAAADGEVMDASRAPTASLNSSRTWTEKGTVVKNRQGKRTRYDHNHHNHHRYQKE